MKIKYPLFAILCLAILSTANAQTSDAEADAIVNLLGVQKRQAVDQLTNVSTKDSVAFWKIYDEYQDLNKKTAKVRMRLYERTARSYNHMTPAVADSLAMTYFANRFDQEKTLQTYYNKIKAATNAVVAFEFYQAEVYLLTQIRASIMQQIPPYGQLEKAAKKK
jgi:hypothetical protein